MIRFHKSTAATREYWEAWISQGKIFVHTGIVGNRGQKTSIIPPPDSNPELLLQQYTAAAVESNFAPLLREEMTSLVICLKLDSFGNEEDLDKRQYIEDLANEALGWTGNGYCDGGDIGSGNASIWCLVLDLEKAALSLAQELERYRLESGVLLAKYDETTADFIAVWPDSQVGQSVDL